MSNYLKFKQLLDKYVETKGEFKPDIVLSYKHEESGFGNLFLGYRPLFELDIDDLIWLSHRYKHLEDYSKAKKIKELKQDHLYYFDLLNESSEKLDKIEVEINNIKNL